MKAEDKTTEIEVGPLLNFGPAPQFRRLIFENERKKIRADPRESAEKKFAGSGEELEDDLRPLPSYNQCG